MTTIESSEFALNLHFHMQKEEAPNSLLQTISPAKEMVVDFNY